jgi:hypothetical protein
LNEDIERYLSVQTVRRAHENRSSTGDAKLKLSDTARMNLCRFLAEDYAALKKLSGMAGLDETRREKLLK